ncbi:MAG: extracellular solute-binding protein [Chloroflexi bacterium]|nr:extracellular solute-binding protein [Chloroflexota bacterium]
MIARSLRFATALTVTILLVAACETAAPSGAPTGAPTGAASPTTGATNAPPSAPPTVDDLGNITIEMWQHTYPPLQAWTQARIDEFTTAHPNVTVELQAIPFQQYQDVLFTALAGGQAPAFFEVNEWTMTQFVEAGILAPLDVAALGFDSLDAMRAAYDGSALEGAVFDGALYGSPYDWTAPVLGVNNQLLADAGVDKASLTTWEATLAALAPLSETDADGNLVESGLSFVHGIDNYYKHQGNNLFAQAGARIFTEDGTASAINSPEAKRVFQLWHDAIHEQKVTQPGFTATFYTNEFGEGRVAAGFMLPWANSILAPFNWQFGREYDILDLPTFEGGTGRLASYAWYWTVNAAASPEEAIVTHALMAHLGDNSASMLTEAGLILPRSAWYERQPADVQAAYATIREALLLTDPLPRHPRYNELWEPVIAVFEAVEANPAADIDALLAAAELQINGIINRP